jgi:hypothetical protein
MEGVVKATSFNAQPPNTTPQANNVWSYHYPAGRLRGGTRPPRSTFSYGGGTPYNWCTASWSGGHGVAVTSSGGTYISTSGTSWSEHIATGPGSDFASCAVFNNYLYQASSAKEKIRRRSLVSGAEENLVVDTYVDTTPKGVVPTYCGLVHSHGGRLWLAGDPSQKHILYASAVNDPRDWDFADPTEGSAWASSGISGQINKPIVGLLTHGNGCLLVGHIDAISAIRGDPQIGGGGAIDELVQFTGPVMQSAWCKTGSDETVILSREDLGIMAPGCGAPPATVSRFRLPAELTAVDPARGDTASVAYDGRYNGVMIYVGRPLGEGVAYTQFFFDLASKAFFPMDFSGGDYRLGVTVPSLITSTKGGSVALKSGGGMYFNTSATESISCEVWLGPIRLGSGNTSGIISSLSAVLSEESDPVDFEVYVGDSAQEAFHSNPNYSGTFSRKGLNYSFHPRSRGNAAYVRLYSTGTAQWYLEQLIGETFPIYRRRVTRDAP